MKIAVLEKSSLSQLESTEVKIKNFISNDKELWHALSQKEDLDGLVSTLNNYLLGNIPGGDYIDTVYKICREILELRKDPGTYLVDSKGQTLFKLTENMMYAPPPSIGEDGTIKEITKQLHPKITSALTLSFHESDKLKILEQKYPNSQAFSHLRDPWLIVEYAAKIIEAVNTSKVSVNADDSFDVELFEIGKENTNGIFQAPNPNFIRTEIFGKSLARKILSLNSSEYLVSKIERCTNSKFSWYEVEVKFRRVASLE